MGNHWCANCPQQQDKGGSRSASGENFDQKNIKGVEPTTPEVGAETASRLKDFKPVLDAYKNAEASGKDTQQTKQQKQQKGLRFVNHGTKLYNGSQNATDADTDFNDTAKLEPDENDVVDIQQIAKDIVDINVFIASQVIYPALQRYREEQEEQRQISRQDNYEYDHNNGDDEETSDERIRLINHNADDYDDDDDSAGSRVRFNVCSKRKTESKQEETEIERQKEADTERQRENHARSCKASGTGVLLEERSRTHDDDDDDDGSAGQETVDRMINGGETCPLLENVACQAISTSASDSVYTGHQPQQQIAQKQLLQNKPQSLQHQQQPIAQEQSPSCEAVNQNRNLQDGEFPCPPIDIDFPIDQNQTISNSMEASQYATSQVAQESANNTGASGAQSANTIDDTTSNISGIRTNTDQASEDEVRAPIVTCIIDEPEDNTGSIPVIVESADISVTLDEATSPSEHKDIKTDLNLDLFGGQLKVAQCQVIIHSPDCPPATTPIYEWLPPIPDYGPGASDTETTEARESVAEVPESSKAQESCEAKDENDVGLEDKDTDKTSSS